MIKLLRKPIIQDNEETRQATIFQKLILGSVIIITLIELVQCFVLRQNYMRWIFIMCLFDLICLGLLFLNRKGFTSQASYVFLSFLFILIFGMAWTAGGIKAPAIQAVMLIILIAAALIGWRVAIFMAFIAILFSLGLVLAQFSGILPVSSVTPTSLSIWVNLVSNTSILCLLQYLIVSSLDKALYSVNNELKLRKKSEDKFRKLIETTNTGYVIIDHIGIVLEANHEYVLLTGHNDIEEIIGRSVAEWTSDDKKEASRLAIEECLKNGFVRNLEITYVDKTGNQTPVEINATITETDGKQEIFALIRSITERKNMEEALRESENKFSKAFSASPQAISIASMDDGKYVEVNNLFCEILGLEKEQIIGRTSSELNVWVNSDDRKRYTRGLIEMGFVRDFETPFRIQNGQVRLFSVSSEIIILNKISCTLNYITDITERKKAEALLVEKSKKIESQNQEYLQINEELNQINRELQLSKDHAEASRQKIKEQSEEIENFFSCAIDLLCIADTQGFFIRLNKEWENTLGYTLEELENKKFLEFIHPDDLNSTLFAINQLDNQIKVSNFTNRYRCKDGSYKWIEWKSYPYGDKIFAAARDITLHKQLEESLIQKTTFFESLLGSTIDGILIIDGNRKKVFQNERMVELFNIPRDVADNIDDQYQLQYVTDNTNDPELFTRKVSYLYDHPEETSEDELELKNGKIFHQYSAPVLSKDLHNYGRIWMFRDITESKQAETALIKAKEKVEESEAKLSTIFKRASVLISISDIKTGLFTDVNDYGLSFSGFSREEVIGHTSTELGWITVEDRSLMIKTLQEFGRIDALELTLRKKNGTFVNVITSGEIIVIQNKEYLLIISIDITLRKKIELELLLAKEKAEESDRLKTAFLQNMSHEIRTPMNAIMGFSDLLYQNADDKEKIHKFTDIISNRCNDLLDIITDILDIAKIESGQLSVNIEECNLNFLFEELTSFYIIYQNRINKQHINFSLSSDCGSSENLILVDKGKLKQIFINLTNNAFKFTENGKIEGGCKFDKNHNLLFYVSDTGIGIPLDKQEIIFERFSQLHQGSKFNVGGTGLGLSIVKGLVHLLGGEIFLESQPGKGSTFSFVIPYVSAKQINNQTLRIENLNEKNYSNKTILIVEDDFYNAEYLKEILSGLGLTILMAVNGNEAITVAISKPIDLILMDIRLPDINGYEVTRQIKKVKPKLKIIAQTAYAAQDEKQKAFDAGCIDYISKPIKKGMLLSLLYQHLITQIST